jgi:hypothetical protein
MTDISTPTMVDVSRAARRFRFIRLANYFMVVGGGTYLIGQLINAPNVTREWVPIVGLVWIGLIVNFWAGLMTAGTIDRAMWRRLCVSLPLLAVCSGTAAVSLFHSMPADINPHSNPRGNAIFVACVLNALFAASGVLALAAVVSLDRARIEPWSLRLRALIDTVEGVREAPPTSGGGRPTSRTKGLLCATAAALILVWPHFVPDETWQPNAQVLSLLGLSGWAFLFHARRYFLPDANALLGGDKRPQVVLLRSFEDDERHSYITSELSVVDFGLESRLANHFRRFGPFVAIGSPKDPTPRPGVATAQLSGEEWQRVVQDWMDRSRYVVLLAGTTHWVNWELSQVIGRGHAGKLILVFPRSPWWGFWRRARMASGRMAKLRETLADTPWAPALALVDRPYDIRALVLRQGGEVMLVTSRPRNRDSYHLAVLVAQRQLLQDAAGAASHSAR